MAGSFNTVLSTLSEPQRLALKAGFDPFSPAVQLAASTPDGMARLLGGKLGISIDRAGGESRSGQRFAPLRDDGDRAGRRSFTGLDGETVTLFKTTGLSQGVFSDLIQRYTLNEIRQAAGLARELGVGANAYAGKFAGLDGDSRSDLRDFVGEMRDDPAMPEEEKRRQIAAFRKAHPKLRRLTDDDLLKIVDARELAHAREVGDPARNARGTELQHRNSDADNAAPTAELKASVANHALRTTASAVAAEADDAFGFGAATKPAVPSTRAASPKAPSPSA